MILLHASLHCCKHVGQPIGTRRTRAIRISEPSVGRYYVSQPIGARRTRAIRISEPTVGRYWCALSTLHFCCYVKLRLQQIQTADRWMVNNNNLAHTRVCSAGLGPRHARGQHCLSTGCHARVQGSRHSCLYLRLDRLTMCPVCCCHVQQ